jgi:hypothetical protein
MHDLEETAAFGTGFAAIGVPRRLLFKAILAILPAARLAAIPALLLDHLSFVGIAMDIYRLLLHLDDGFLA